MFELLNEAVKAGSNVLLKYFRTQLDISNKTDHQNIVTIADKESQQVIQDSIVRLMKEKGETDVGFIGEEDLYNKGKHMFVIDPLDGTSNFASGIDYFCTPIAYFRDGKLIAGIVSHPTHNDVYYGEKDTGAFLIRNNKKVDLKISNTDLKSKMLILYPEEMAVFEKPLREKLEKTFVYFRGVRSPGAAALDIVGVAENTYGCAMIGFGTSIWDVSASHLIIKEAGGNLYNWDGTEIQYDLSDKNKKYPYVACSAEQKDKIFSWILD